MLERLEQASHERHDEYDALDFEREVEAYEAESLRRARAMVEEEGGATDVLQAFLKREESKSPADWELSFLNNFPHRLPGGYKRMISEEILGDADASPQDRKGAEKNQEFFAAFDETAKRLGVDLGVVDHQNVALLKKLYIAMRQAGYDHIFLTQ